MEPLFRLSILNAAATTPRTRGRNKARRGRVVSALIPEIARAATTEPKRFQEREEPPAEKGSEQTSEGMDAGHVRVFLYISSNTTTSIVVDDGAHGRSL